ncbi:DISARM system helicase DrmA [Fusibacter ferrireducens]|uniref:Helicase n=1 Tax=Fusibacter ferrireducens TaxID=2785058 RepID=A0ABR9ZM87_9FIRM|nr:DISARM system helicase DrmA [Fusibacter ferrireducens]MBF4691582.1 helicase [Fusibacter ferrireducens]
MNKIQKYSSLSKEDKDIYLQEIVSELESAKVKKDKVNVLKIEREITAMLRSEFVDAMKTDFIGPYPEEEELKISESPSSNYLTGILQPKSFEDEEIVDYIESNIGEKAQNEYINKQEFDEYERDRSENDDEEDDDKNISKFKSQSSAGLNFFLDLDVKKLNVLATWGEYETETYKQEYIPKNSDEIKIKNKRRYRRKQINKDKKYMIDLFDDRKELKLTEDGIFLRWVCFKLLNTEKTMVALYLSNEREKKSNKQDITKNMYQVELEVEGVDCEHPFVSRTEAYGFKTSEDYYYKNKPYFGQGYGCAVNWEKPKGQRTSKIKISFLPTEEIPGVSPDRKKFIGKLSMKKFSMDTEKENTIGILNALADEYEEWIDKEKYHEFMNDENYRSKGNDIIKKCEESLSSIRKGILLLDDNIVFESFKFMNEALHFSRALSKFSKDRNAKEAELLELRTENHSFWRPFQIAFILKNIESIVDKKSNDSKNVELLYFPTGGGKTEAYLGIIVFAIALRRFRKDTDVNYEYDGGVTVFLRYTLRLLTTQQRDRLLKVISAAELLRHEGKYRLGKAPISIGFWVGGTTTPNKFDDLVENEYRTRFIIERLKGNLYDQIRSCPICGTKLTAECHDLSVKGREKFHKIYCSKKGCAFSRESGKRIPVDLIDEAIYRNCPTVVIATVDKFAQIATKEDSHLLFGKRDRYLEGYGNILCGSEFKSRKKPNIVKPFFPPELIIQDELHLITGPLGTLYGHYETAIEELCRIYYDDWTLMPKYIASTATIRNALDQIQSLYGKKFTQFPAPGHESASSFFAEELDLDINPFRLYAGIYAPGSSVKTTVLRVYAVIIQTAMRFRTHEIFKNYLDPYWTLIGYFNSKRELGGTVRLLQDDIPSRVKVLANRNNDEKPRTNIKYKEITSRIKSKDIPLLLEELENGLKNGDNGNEILDAVVATNMISVGMDVDRLGVMAVTGQPKTTSEYIQATSRVGRSMPGLVFNIINPYRNRDMSHFENFKAYHGQLYRFVEGTTATPFSTRARERSLHALLVAMLRGMHDEMRANNKAYNLNKLEANKLSLTIEHLLDRVRIVDPMNTFDTESEILAFIDEWKILISSFDHLHYIEWNSKNTKVKKKKLFNYPNNKWDNHERTALQSLRNVEEDVEIYHWEGYDV